ncbi:MAG: transporter related protein [Frankiales bacterium]|nr:transporter related protein [Frankiales bacterium]
MMNSLVVRHLRVVRGRREVIHDVDFTLRPGELTGLLGPSGCGKTTLMRAVVGVQRGVTGDVEVLGLPAGSAALRTRIGYVTQAPSVYDDLSVAENLRYFAAVLDVDSGRVGEVLDAVDLTGRAEQLTRSLSGGERARVSLAVALLATPDLLVLDEPTVGLDPVLRRDLWALFHSLADRGTSLLISSHVMDEAVRCDRLLLMREGRFVADESPAELLRRTGAPDVEHAFLALAEPAA